MNTQWFVAYAIMGVLCQAIPAFAQNPGQSSGMRVVRGEVKQATLKTIVVEEKNGKEATMLLDAATAGDRDIRPGDVITVTVTAQGRAVTIHKEVGAEASHKDDSGTKNEQNMSVSGGRINK
jgi:hypothetical protein